MRQAANPLKIRPWNAACWGPRPRYGVVCGSRDNAVRSMARGASRSIRHVAAAWLGVLALVLQTYFPLAVTAIAAHLEAPDAAMPCAATAGDDAAAGSSARSDAPEKPPAPPAGHVHHHCPECCFDGAGKGLAASDAAPSPRFRSVADRLTPAEPARTVRHASAAFYSPR